MQTPPFIARLAALAAVVIAASNASAQGIDTMWNNNCMKCHGDRGQGGGAGTSTLLTRELMEQTLDRRFFDAIKSGVPDKGMDAFGATLSDQQIWGLVVYIRELQARDDRRKTGSPKATGGVYSSQHHSYRIERVIERGLEIPWSVDFLPPAGQGAAAASRMLVANRPGEVMIHSTGLVGGSLGKPIEGTPKVRHQGQGGMMDVAVHPECASKGPGAGWIYLAYTEPMSREGRNVGMTKIVRGKIAESGGVARWTDQQTIFEAKPEHYLGSDLHFGSRIVFRGPIADGPKKGQYELFFAIGERGRQEHAQELARPNGKVHRVYDDGEIPADNPFADDASRAKGVYPSIWSYGHRNPQGLAFGVDGTLWDTEHGPRGGDELNIVTKGANYGWPLVSFGINYSGAPFVTPWPSDSAEQRDLVMPVYRWLPSIGACGLDVVRPGPSGEMFPKWKGDLMAGGLSGANVDRLRVVDGKLVEREEIVHGLGRVRDVVTGPDGSIYVVLNDPDHVVRVAPTK